MKKRRWLAVLLCLTLVATGLPITAKAETEERPFALYDAMEDGELIEPAEDGSYDLTCSRNGLDVYFKTIGDATFDEDCLSYEGGPVRASRIDATTYQFSLIRSAGGTHTVHLCVNGVIYDVVIRFEQAPPPSEPDGPDEPGSSNRAPMPMPFWDAGGNEPVEESTVTYRPEEETVFYLIGTSGPNSIKHFTDRTKTIQGIPLDIRVEQVPVGGSETEFIYRLTIPANMGGDFYCRYSVEGGGGGDLDFDDVTCQDGSQNIMLRAYDAETGTYGKFSAKFPEVSGTTTYGVFQNGVLIQDYAVSLLSAVDPAPGSVVKEEDGKLTVTVTGTEGFWIGFSMERPMGDVAFGAAAEINQVQNVTIDGKTYTLAWGMPNQGAIFTGPSTIGWSAESLGKVTGPYQLAFALFENYGTMEQSPAMDQISAIKRIEANVLTDEHEIFSSMNPRGWEDGLWTLDYNLLVKPAVLIMAVEVDIETDNGLQTIQLKSQVKMDVGSNIYIDCRELGLDTVEKLNAYIQNEMPLDPYSTTVLQLIPGHTYEGTIVANRAGRWILQGTKSDKNPTIIKGTVEVCVDFSHVMDLLFLAPEGENTSAFIPNGGSTSFRNCGFFGYDTALNGTEYGRADASDCLFVKNKTAISINGGTLGFGNVMTGNTFLNNDCAVDIVELPDGMVPYNVRFTESDFINNGYDIRVPDGGNYYAHGNYFGHDDGPGAKWRAALVNENVYTGIGYKHPLTPAKNSADTWWLWHLTKNNNIIKHDNVVLLSENAGETELDLFLRSEEAPRMEQVEYNPLVATGSTSLRSSDATDLQISEEGLKGQLEIQVMNDDDRPAGTWQFGTELNSGTERVSLFGMMDMPEEFNFGMDVWVEDGVVMVYVNDTLALRNLRPLVQVSCDVGANAVVTLNGEPVAAFGDETSVTFQAVGGGTYEIRSGSAVTLSAVQSRNEKGLTLEVRVENWTEEVCSGTPFCAVYDRGGKLLAVGYAAEDTAVQSGGRAVIPVTVELSPEQLGSAAHFTVFLLDQSYCPISKATIQKVLAK